MFTPSEYKLNSTTGDSRVEIALFMFIFALGFVSFHCRGECWVRATPLSEPVLKWAPGTPRDLSTNSKLSYEISLQSYTHFFLFILSAVAQWFM